MVEAEDPKIEYLRQKPDLQQAVRARMRQLGLNPSDSSDSDVETGHSRGYSSKPGKLRQPRSGISSKISDVHVINQQMYAHAALQLSYTSKNVAFKDLTFQLYVAGEIEISSMDSVSQEERSGRLALLKLLAYKCEKFEWSILRDAYGAWLQQIERGCKTWADDPASVVSHIIEDYVLDHKSTKSKYMVSASENKTKSPLGRYSALGSNYVNSTWFCSNYNRNKCRQTGEHEASINGIVRLVQHICATCWRKDKSKQNHPECSSACPYSLE